MEKIYRIGSFNLHNIGVGAFTNSRDLEKIANIILEENLDVVALQEVLSEGKIFTKEDLPSSITKKNIISYLGGPDKWGFSWAFSGDESVRHEGYAFLWNKNRLGLSTAEINRNGTKFTREYNPRMIKINHQDMRRQPYFARFTAQGRPGGSGFEIRLLCVHTFFGNDMEVDRIIRQQELDVLLKDIYPQVADWNFQNALPQYTVLLGDYNAELITSENLEGHEKLNMDRKLRKERLPAVMETNLNGEVYSDRYGVTIKTVQYELTTLKKRIDDITGMEEFAERGLSSNYDHFSYDENALGHVIEKKPRRIDAVRTYCGDDYEKYFKTVSDHLPIIMELKIN